MGLLLIIPFVCFLSITASAQTITNLPVRTITHKSFNPVGVNENLNPVYTKWTQEFDRGGNFYMSGYKGKGQSFPNLNIDTRSPFLTESRKTFLINSNAPSFINSSYNTTSLPTPFKYTTEKKLLWQEVLGAGLMFLSDRKHMIITEPGIQH